MKQRLNRNKMVPVLLAAAVVLSATSIPYSEVHAKTSAPAAHQKSSAKTLKPVWQKNLGSLDQPQMGYTFDKGVVYYNAGTSLSAANLKTGKTKWSYKSTPSSAPITNLGYVYFTDTSGRIHKVNAKTGKSAWVKKAYAAPKSGKGYEPSSIDYYSGMLILSDAYGLTAYDTKTGKLKWKTERKGNSSYNIEMMNGLLLASSTVSGAITTTQLHAISAYTGQIKWTYNGNFQDLLQTGPELHILRYNNGIDNGYALTIDVLEYSTGKMLNTLEYQPVPFVEMESAKKVASAFDHYFFTQNTRDNGGQLAVVPHQAPNYSSAVKTYQYDAVITQMELSDSKDSTIVMSLADGRIVLKNVKTGKDKVTSYPSKISRFDILENVVVIGLADGRLVLKDIRTGKDVATYKLGSGDFLEITRTIRDELLIQTGGKLYYVPLPASLKS
ncbi:PQQ-binding-like beta-propeller repeat protein [Paenibacillus cisolokensis]|uniref:outer membrane protein assembly factor BamB family protein n=1 Tax=Paenibacillus cisolokensis TaxID=1658519 RepID=UPI003D2D17C7